ncbi:MAG: universal stress protein [Chloroflexota bacterium]
MNGQGDRATPRALLATDGSIAARAAESWVTRARWAKAPEIEVLCMAPIVAGLAWALPPDHEEVRRALELLTHDEEGVAQQIAQEVVGRLRETGLSATASVRSGQPAVGLLERAADLRPTLVTMGSRGQTDREAMLLGSVTQQLTEHSMSPVLVARATGTPPGTIPQRLLIVAESSSTARATVDWLSDQGWLRDARVTLLGLLGITPGLAARAEPLAEEIASEIRLWARDDLGELVDTIGRQAADVTLELQFGHPLKLSLELADALGVDLVAVARPPHQPGQYPFAELLARYAARSVLLVPVT